MRANGTLFVSTLFFVILIVMLVPTVSASSVNRTYTTTGGVITCDNVCKDWIKDEVTAGNPIFVVYKGEKIRFRNSTGCGMTGIRIDGKFTSTGVSSSNFKTSFISEEWATEGKYEGYYRFSDDANRNGAYFEKGVDNQGWLSLDTHTFRLDLYPADKTYADGSLHLSIESNNKEAGFMQFSIESQGHSIRDVNGRDIYEILIEYRKETIFWNISEALTGVALQDGIIVLNMSGLDVDEGRYTIVLEDSATGVEKKINFEIKPREIELKVNDKIVKGETAEIIVKSAFSNKNVRLMVDDGNVFNQSATLNKEGEKLFLWDTATASHGRHEIRIQVDVDGDGEFGGYEDEEASCSIEVLEGDVTVAAPDEAILGDPVVIEGTSTYGDSAVILIAGKYVGKVMIYRNKFTYEYETTGEFEGPKKVEVFIDAPLEFSLGVEVSEDWKRRNKADADTEFALIELQKLTLSVHPITAEGDDVWINGTAAGVDKVYLLVLNHEGEVIVPYGAEATSTPVNKEGNWDEKLIEPDVGTYTALVLHTGRDGVTEALYDGRWEIGGESKTRDQRIAIVEEKIKGAGSDDLFVKKDFKVVNPVVTLELEDVALGENLTIVARTNVEKGAIAWLSMGKEGSTDKETKTAKVENGTIVAEFDTNTFSIGSWEVCVEILDRCADTGIVNITAETASPAATALSNATATPSPSLTPNQTMFTPEESQGAPVPGFDCLVSLVLLIAVACLIRLKASRDFMGK